jgi:hypothetical protein
MSIFLSHNSADKEIARKIGTNLLLTGAEVWFDEWEVAAGESLPEKIGEGLSSFETFLLLWSGQATRSNWVRSELESALVRRMNDKSLRIIPVRIDDAPLPALLSPLRYLKWDGEDSIPSIVNAVMGFSTERDRLKAIQQAFEDLYLEVGYFHGYGALIACPRCGAGVDAIRGWSQTDYARDDVYAGAECMECGWNDGGEI